MSLISPPALRAGDTVAIVSLSAGVSAAVPHRHDAGIRQLEQTFDVHVVDAPNARRDDAFLRANPRARADDLHWALAENAVAGILTSIGGDDSIRMIPYLDFDMIRDHPKVFMGFSDTTVQHLANRVAGVVSFYGPSLLTAFAENGGIHPYVEECVRDALFRSEPLQLRAAPEWTDERLDWANPLLASRRRRWWPNPGWAWLQGTEPVEGELIGGCADTLETVKGTAIWPPPSTWDGAILLLELSEEAPAPYTVELWLQNYGATGILGRLGALLLSRPETYTLQRMFELWDRVQRVLAEWGRADLVIVANLDYGHSSPMGVLPLGVRARVDPIERTIRTLAPAVTRDAADDLGLLVVPEQ
jgi:muramoyltetrapeptide carboxypeptidase LdcA involved in peptidoglycan recycling